ncbi:DUF92 domain-containing protein [Priestia flexa]|nr:DUF92 domain-containing protein [Priestia flexa]
MRRLYIVLINSFLIYVIICFVSFIGYVLRVLSRSGAIMAAAVGISIYIGFELKGLLLLGMFFGTSTFFSQYKKVKKKLVEEKVAKHDQRDHIQVAANGGVAALSALLFFSFESHVFLMMFAVSLAAANADTWASEIGVLSKKKPVFILTFKQVDPGTSGAISILGTAASIGGSLIIAATAFYAFPELSIIECLFISMFGFLGNLIDTFLGATIQLRYRCSVCFLQTEKEQHCGIPTLYEKGWNYCNNDAVNLLSVMFATILGGIFLSYVKPRDKVG